MSKNLSLNLARGKPEPLKIPTGEYSYELLNLLTKFCGGEFTLLNNLA